MTPQAFVSKWRRSELKERAAAQEHFLDLCHLLGHPTPAEADPHGTSFTFEKGASKTAGGEGWADVWKKGFFAWEYKGKHKDLEAAYAQLLQYREALLNPPVLVVSDMETILIRTNFTNTVRQEWRLTLDDLLTPEGIQTLRWVFTEPDRLRAGETAEGVTRQVAREFSRLADALRARGEDPHHAAHFLIRLLFCLFAEDIGLLPNRLFCRLVVEFRDDPARFQVMIGELFAAMRAGGYFGVDRVPHVNGGLFDGSPPLRLEGPDLEILARASELDWSAIEPSIFGTLFERSLDPNKRAQLGAHYTSREDILLVVEPVLMAPLRRRWSEVRAEAQALAAKRQGAKEKTRIGRQLAALLTGFADEIAHTTVLDPACGSGNFLYVALRQLMDLEKEVITLSADLDVGRFFPTVSPRQLHGIEINEYAHELAQATIQIGYIQWLRENGFGWPSEPILKEMGTIERRDAILAFDAGGHPVEPEWPPATVVVGNPPFLGGKLLRRELGDAYVDQLFRLYDGRVARESDLCCYWFERARREIERGQLKRAGLLATQGIRGGANRRVLDRIRQAGDIFWAQSDREWVLEGAAVHVSMVAFGDGAGVERELDGNVVSQINSDLTGSLDLTTAQRVRENLGISFMGDTKGGPFDIPDTLAREMLSRPTNPNGRPNSDVIRPWVNARDITGRPRAMWIIDFGTERAREDAAAYEGPFSHVEEHVRPMRQANKRAAYRDRYWLHAEARPEMRACLSKNREFIATPRHSKHRIFLLLTAEVLVDSALIAFSLDASYFFGVLNSCPHELWARRRGSQVREVESGFRYTPTTCFETFPFPWPPGHEPQSDPRVQAIAAAAKDLVEKRDRWLNPPEWTKTEVLEFPGTVGGQWDRFIDPATIVARGDVALGTVCYPRLVPRDEACAKLLAKRTLTNLYNERPTWLDLAHQCLDQAVFAAYGWPADLSAEEILERLLSLNLARSEQ